MILGRIKNLVFPFLPRKARIAIERAYFGYYLRVERRLFKQLCAKDKVSLDVGANKGDIALFLEQYSKKVICFEPIGSLCAEIRKRLGSLNVEVFELALSDIREEKQLTIPLVQGEFLDTRATLIDLDNESSEECWNKDCVKKIKIQTDRLDNLKIDNVGFIKIDVEGWEYEVLVGGRETIQKFKPNIYIEIEERHLQKRAMSADMVFKYLSEMEYVGYYYKEGTYWPIDTFDWRSMQVPENELTGQYVNNFVFMHLLNNNEINLGK